VCRHRGSARDRRRPLGSCWAGGDEGTRSDGGRSIDVAIVDMPNTQDLAHLTPSLFTDKTGIKVNQTILDEAPCARSPRATWPRRVASPT
jgi:hypothetical protein